MICKVFKPHYDCIDSQKVCKRKQFGLLISITIYNLQSKYLGKKGKNNIGCNSTTASQPVRTLLRPSWHKMAVIIQYQLIQLFMKSFWTGYQDTTKQDINRYATFFNLSSGLSNRREIKTIAIYITCYTYLFLQKIYIIT